MTTETTFTSDSELFSANIGRPVYTLRQVQVATFFGGPLAGTYMIARNFKAFDQPQFVRKTWLAGIGATLLYFGIVFNLPTGVSFLSYGMTAALLYGVTQAVKKWQEFLLSEHLSQGGKVWSNWNCFAVILVAILCLSMLLGPYFVYIIYHQLPQVS